MVSGLSLHTARGGQVSINGWQLQPKLRASEPESLAQSCGPGHPSAVMLEHCGASATDKSLSPCPARLKSHHQADVKYNAPTMEGRVEEGGQEVFTVDLGNTTTIPSQEICTEVVI